MSTNLESTNNGQDKLDVLRAGIDELDEQIIGFVLRRTTLSLAVAEEKARRGISTMVPGRHNEVLQHYMDGVDDDSPMTVQDAVALAEAVMAISRDAQDRFRTEQEQQATAAHEAEVAELNGLAAEAAARAEGA